LRPASASARHRGFPAHGGAALRGPRESLGALGEVTSRGDNQEIFLSAQRVQSDEPTPEDIFSVGTLANVIQVLRLPTAQ